MFLYYNVLKHYAGTFKKTFKGNTHFLIVPKSPKKYLYLAITGQYDTDSYVCYLIVSFPERLLKSIISGELEHFGKRYQVIEKLECFPEVIDETTTRVVLKDSNKPSKNIKSDLLVKYFPELNFDSRKMYLVVGNLDLKVDEITTKEKVKLLAKQTLPGNHTNQEVKKMSLDRAKLLEAGKLFLKEVCLLSPKFKKLGKEEKTGLIKFINKLTLEELMVLVFKPEKLQEEIKPRRLALAGLAGGLAGAYLGHGKIRKPGLLGAAAAIGAYYLYKRLSDPCDRLKSPYEKARCKAEGAKKVISTLKQNLEHCQNTPAPEVCAIRIQKQIDKWNQIYSDLMSKAIGVEK